MPEKQTKKRSAGSQMWANLWGFIAAGIGLLSIWPSFPAFSQRPGVRRLALAQLVATEDPGLAIGTGLLALWRGWRARSRRALLLGAVGTALGLRPLYRRDQVNRAMADAMRDGLGLGWQREIPAEHHRAFAQRHRVDTWGPLRYLLRAKVRETRDVLFAAPDGRPLRLDVYEPALGEGPFPAIVVVHGGAWFHGDKSYYAFGLHDRWLAGQGYVVFDVQYRLSGRWPAPLADVKHAIRWVRSNATRFNVDPGQIALMGRAAGAHLALMAAYTANDPDFAREYFGEDGGATGGATGSVDDSVQAVVASYPPADLRLWPAEDDSAIAHLLGGLPEDRPDVYAEASPVTHVRPGLPPTLLVHGQRDRMVSPVHSELLTNRLRAAGVTTVLLRIPWGRHGVDGLLVGLTGPMIQYDVDRFLAWVFHRESNDSAS
ncbi:MAG: alpha/beta hydrolase [Chloroflexi bacterium]|nr:alpha/beta hydrolase [Chloroflexota bacterium]